MARPTRRSFSRTRPRRRLGGLPAPARGVDSARAARPRRPHRTPERIVILTDDQVTATWAFTATRTSARRTDRFAKDGLTSPGSTAVRSVRPPASFMTGRSPDRRHSHGARRADAATKSRLPKCSGPLGTPRAVRQMASGRQLPPCAQDRASRSLWHQGRRDGQSPTINSYLNPRLWRGGEPVGAQATVPMFFNAARVHGRSPRPALLRVSRHQRAPYPGDRRVCRALCRQRSTTPPRASTA